MPFEALTTELQSRGIDVLLDASHSLGLIDLDLNATPAAYATGNAHKWLCTPKGSAFLYVRPDKREDFHPLAISHGYSAAVDEQARFEAEFEWIGTLDPTPWLCIPHALDMLGGLLDGGWPVLQKRNHELALYGRDVICDALGIEPPVPDSMLSAMATVELPAQDVARPTSGLSIDPLMQRLYDEYRIQTVVFYWPHHQRRYLRISAALYNERQDYDYLATALKRCLAI